MSTPKQVIYPLPKPTALGNNTASSGQDSFEDYCLVLTHSLLSATSLIICTQRSFHIHTSTHTNLLPLTNCVTVGKLVEFADLSLLV